MADGGAARGRWDVFSELLEGAQVVTIPGAGFGPGGEGFIRLSAFAPRDACEEARRTAPPHRSGGSRARSDRCPLAAQACNRLRTALKKPVTA